MYKKLLLVSILIILSIGMVSASDNVTDGIISADSQVDVELISVDESDCLQSTIAVSGKTFEDIQNAVDNAKSNDVITLSGTYSGKSSQIFVDKDLTIQGDSNKATLDAKGLSSIIYSYDGQITLKNIIFTNSESNAVTATGSCIIENCDFKNNELYGVYAFGSADSASLTVKNSIFEGNYGGIDSDVNNLAVEKSTFTSNKVGAIGIYSSATKSTSVSIKDSTFKSNTGTPINLNMKDGSATVSGCTFSNNADDNVGGAIYITSSGKYVANILSSTFNSNSAKNYNSALALSDVDGNIKNCAFINNNAKEEDIVSVGSFPGKMVSDNNIIKSSAGVNENLKVEVISSPAFFGDVCQIKFTKDASPLANKQISAYLLKRDSVLYYNVSFKTDSDGIGKFGFNSPGMSDVAGNWDMQFILDSGNSKLLVSKNNLNIKELNGDLVLGDLTTTYNSGKVYSLKLINKDNNKVAGGINLYVTVYKNGAYLKNLKIKTDVNGVANIKLSNFVAADYKISIDDNEASGTMDLAKKTAKIKINKASTKVSAPKVTNKYKKSKYFKVTVKAYNKPVNKLKIKVKVFTGKKSKTYTITTNSKGIAKLNTKSLSKGTHKVQISSGNGNYKVSAKSTIKIKK